MDDQVIMKDEEIAVLLPARGFTKGHLIVVPLKEYVILEDVPDQVLGKMFQAANTLSAALFDKIGCTGTNLLVQNGAPAGQFNKIFSINIIPRHEGDGLKLEWEPKQADEESLKKALAAFESFEDSLSEKNYVEEQKRKAESEPDEEEVKESYLAKSIERIP